MIIYHYSKLTGEFLNEGKARENPLEPGKYLIPANATTIKPPKARKRKTPVWTNAWSLVDDYRGEKYWDISTKEELIISDLGIKPEKHLTNIEPSDRDAVWNGESWQVPFEIFKARKKRQLHNTVEIKLEELKANVTNTEFESWARQESGAIKLMENPESIDIDASYVRLLAQEREMEITVLVGKIIQKAHDYAMQHARLVGSQQKIEDLIDSAETEEELEQIEIEL